MNMIKDLREKMNLSQGALAKAVGTSQPQILRLENGDRKLTKEWAVRLAPALNTTPEELMFADTVKVETSPDLSVRIFRESSTTPSFPYPESMSKDIPLMGTSAGSHTRGAFKLGSDVIEYVRRPPGLIGVKGIYALYVEGSSMEPQYFPGDLIFINSNRPARNGDVVVIQVMEDEDGVESSLGILVRQSATTITLGKRNPQAEISIPKHAGTKIHKVLTNNELFGI